jgi:hypothetical protein
MNAESGCSWTGNCNDRYIALSSIYDELNDQQLAVLSQDVRSQYGKRMWEVMNTWWSFGGPLDSSLNKGSLLFNYLKVNGL